MPAHRDARRSKRRQNLGIGAGLLLVAIGMLTLAHNLGYVAPWSLRWWALLPLGFALFSLWRAVQILFGPSTERRSAALKFAFAACWMTVAVIIWEQASWSRWWPSMLIVGGAVLIARRWVSHAVTESE